MKPHECDTCDRCFATERGKEDHMNALGHYGCDTCDRRFVTRHGTECHMSALGHWADSSSSEYSDDSTKTDDNSEVSEKPSTSHACQSCRKTFGQAHKLHRHMNVQGHWKNGVKCQSCKRNFRSRQGCEQHMNATGHRIQHNDRRSEIVEKTTAKSSAPKASTPPPPPDLHQRVSSTSDSSPEASVVRLQDLPRSYQGLKQMPLLHESFIAATHGPLPPETPAERSQAFADGEQPVVGPTTLKGAEKSETARVVQVANPPENPNAAPTSESISQQQNGEAKPTGCHPSLPGPGGTSMTGVFDAVPPADPIVPPANLIQGRHATHDHQDIAGADSHDNTDSKGSEEMRDRHPMLLTDASAIHATLEAFGHAHAHSDHQECRHSSPESHEPWSFDSDSGFTSTNTSRMPDSDWHSRQGFLGSGYGCHLCYEIFLTLGALDKHTCAAAQLSAQASSGADEIPVMGSSSLEMEGLQLFLESLHI